MYQNNPKHEAKATRIAFNSHDTIYHLKQKATKCLIQFTKGGFLPRSKLVSKSQPSSGKKDGKPKLKFPNWLIDNP